MFRHLLQHRRMFWLIWLDLYAHRVAGFTISLMLLVNGEMTPSAFRAGKSREQGRGLPGCAPLT